MARLATDATLGLADLVEAVHERIARLPGLPPAEQGRTSGITGLVYRSVRGVTRVAGGSVDALLGLLTPALAGQGPQRARSLEHDAVLAALNGVLGDHLAATANPLATPISLRRNGLPLDLQAQAGDKLAVLVHGLCMNDRQWLRNGHDHGAALARDAGYTPVYLRYNTGLHVSTNGREFAAQLEQLLQAWPQALSRFVIIGHSMGGQVARSALYQAQKAGQAWPRQLSDLVFVGTPHHGAPLERAGNWVDVLLGATPYAAPFARLGKLRSAGITDLRHGYLLDEDWAGRDRFAASASRHTSVPLPDGVRCWALAASLSPQPGALRERALGDGLVPVASALGRHRDAARRLGFAPERQWVGQDMGHLALLSRPEVYAQLRQWLG